VQDWYFEAGVWYERAVIIEDVSLAHACLEMFMNAFYIRIDIRAAPSTSYVSGRMPALPPPRQHALLCAVVGTGARRAASKLCWLFGRLISVPRRGPPYHRAIADHRLCDVLALRAAPTCSHTDSVISRDRA
jgi:hypothetical protein